METLEDTGKGFSEQTGNKYNINQKSQNDKLNERYPTM